MSEEQAEYKVENEIEDALEMLGKGYTPVVQFEKPSEQIAEFQGEYKLVKSLGWIKFSADFRNSMLAKLKGAKLSIFISICLHLNENGESFPGVDLIAKETGYNRDTVMNAIAEMEDIPNLLEVLRKRGKVNHYRPSFAARGAGNEPVGFSDQSDFPTRPVQKSTTGFDQTSLGNLDSKESKRIKQKPLSIENAIFAGQQVTDEMVNVEALRSTAPKMFETALGFSKSLPWWTSKEWTDFSEWVCEQYEKSRTIFGEYNIWRNTPYTKGGMSNNRIRGFIKEFYDSWDMFMMSTSEPQQEKVRLL